MINCGFKFRKYFIFFLLISTFDLYALIGINAVVGSKSVKFINPSINSNDKLTGFDLGLGAYIDPIPLIPIGFGLSLHSTSYGKKAGYDKINQITVIPEVLAWIPFPLVGLNPFAKVGYGLSSFEFEHVNDDGTTLNTTEAKAIVRGVHYTAGIKWAPLGFDGVAILAQADFAQEKSKIKSASFNGVPQTLNANAKKDNDFKSSAFHIGIELKL